jgi:hypothetical protein
MMDEDGRTDYFEMYAQYFERLKQPYVIRVGGTTLFAADTMELRRKFDAFLAA